MLNMGTSLSPNTAGRYMRFDMAGYTLFSADEGTSADRWKLKVSGSIFSDRVLISFTAQRKTCSVWILNTGWQHNWLTNSYDFHQEIASDDGELISQVSRENGVLLFGDTDLPMQRKSVITIPSAVEVDLTRALIQRGLVLPIGVNTRNESLSASLLAPR